VGRAIGCRPVIEIDRANGGNVGDCVLLCGSPKERDFSNNPRLPLVLRDRLRRQPSPIELFNPRGQDFANLDSVRRLGGLLRLCLDPTGVITDKVRHAIGQHARQTLDRWADDVHTLLMSGSADPDIVDYVKHWMRRQPPRAGLIWPSHIPCIELLYGLVHWMPELYDDPEGQIYLEVFTRQLSAAEQVSGFKAQVVVDDADPNLERNSVGHLLMYFPAPIADGTAKVDEELMDSFPRDRLSVLSIHQSKGLEFPLVIVDVGSDSFAAIIGRMRSSASRATQIRPITWRICCATTTRWASPEVWRWSGLSMTSIDSSLWPSAVRRTCCCSWT
jgi:DNA helicase-2/ATP-dependent DNA helicase PcrA